MNDLTLFELPKARRGHPARYTDSLFVAEQRIACPGQRRGANEE